MDANLAYRHDGFVPVVHVCSVIEEYIDTFKEHAHLAAKSSIALGGIVPNLLRAPKARPYRETLNGVGKIGMRSETSSFISSGWEERRPCTWLRCSTWTPWTQAVGVTVPPGASSNSLVVEIGSSQTWASGEDAFRTTPSGNCSTLAAVRRVHGLDWTGYGQAALSALPTAPHTISGWSYVKLRKLNTASGAAPTTGGSSVISTTPSISNSSARAPDPRKHHRSEWLPPALS